MGKYVAAIYDQVWYVGNLVECEEEKDVLVNFLWLHPKVQNPSNVQEKKMNAGFQGMK